MCAFNRSAIMTAANVDCDHAKVPRRFASRKQPRTDLQVVHKKRVLKANAKKATNEAELLIKIEIKYFNMENRETTKCYKETVEKEKRELTY